MAYLTNDNGHHTISQIFHKEITNMCPDISPLDWGDLFIRELRGLGWQLLDRTHFTCTDDKAQSQGNQQSFSCDTSRGVRCEVMARSDSMRSRHADNLIGALMSPLEPTLTRHQTGGLLSQRNINNVGGRRLLFRSSYFIVDIHTVVSAQQLM